MTSRRVRDVQIHNHALDEVRRGPIHARRSRPRSSRRHRAQDQANGCDKPEANCASPALPDCDLSRIKRHETPPFGHNWHVSHPQGTPWPLTARKGVKCCASYEKSLWSRLNGPVQDPGGFDQWVRVHWRELVRISRIVCGDAAAAEEALQEALIDVYPRWAQIAQGNPVGYLTRVMASKAANRQRTAWARRVWTRPAYGEQEGRSDRDMTASVINRLDVAAALGRLRPRQRAVLALHYLMDLSVVDVAAALNLPIGTVTSDLSRGRALLRASLGGAEDE